jgi:hypothetical protein
MGYLIALLSGTNPSLIPLLSAVIGLVVAFTIPAWQALALNAPKLEVEISAIQRSVSDLATLPVNDYPELAVLRTPTDRIFRYQYLDEDNPRENPFALNITQLDRLLARAKVQLKDMPLQIEERRKELQLVENLTPTAFTKMDCDRLNRPLDPEIDFDPADKEGTIKALIESYTKRQEIIEKRHAELHANLPAAERKVEQLRAEQIDNRSYFTLSASLINSGRTNTAIKVPALLRVSIGVGNYIDIKLSLKDFENKSEISANGTSIVLFESPEISSFPEDDRRLIKTYWGQSVSACLYIEDIHARAYGSNRIAFAEGLYQKIVYDRLAKFASNWES